MALRGLNNRNDVRFEDTAFDVRKQEVRSRIDQNRIGTVEDMLIDDRGRTRYLSVTVEGENRQVLLPVGQTEADRKNNIVWVAGMNRKSFSSVPEYNGDPDSVNEVYERRLNTAYESAYSDEHYYDRPEYRSTAWGRETDRTGSGRLERLDQNSDVDVASDEPDPRGWTIIGRDGRELGKVDHLIGDTGAMKVRYLVMKADRGIVKDDRSLLIPIGLAELDTRRNRVIVNGLDATTVHSVPVYTGSSITREDERKICAAFADCHTGEDRYRHARYRDENLYGRSETEGARDREQRITRSEEELRVGTRERKAGEVEVKKHVEIEQVRTPVTTHRQEVEVERRPATGENASGRMGDQEVVIPVTQEEVIVEKRPRVKEEIVVRTRDVADREIVEEDVRKERVEINQNRSRTDR